ncbi:MULTISPECIES: hypothetical protein [unclassified Lentimonas]|uniref:hypothetical protein n=1 Tax=unclassified Lentimonas TaxID=2630993 RepID=UPI0013898018|nr:MULTISPECIES: hypothetical protein [unclassified Lentimonas]
MNTPRTRSALRQRLRRSAFNVGRSTFNLSSTFFCLFSFLGATLPATAAIPTAEYDAIYAELHQPIDVHLNNGRTIPGHSIDVSGDQIQVATSEGAGEIIHTFNVNQVDHFTIPGESCKSLAVEWMKAGETENALELMQLLYLQRVKILPLMPPSESHFFIYYVDLILESDNPARAIAVTAILKPQITHPAALRALDDAVLDSYNTLQLYEKARPLTEAWLAQRDPYGDSALGYYTHSADLLRSEHYDEALDTALQPIVFSTPNPPQKLAHCYAVAISAALGLHEKDYALTLYHEMQELALTWPAEDPTFEAPFKQLNEHLEKQADKAKDPKANASSLSSQISNSPVTNL